MYYKIEPSGCQEHKGLCEVRYDLFLEPTDEGYSEHHVTVPIFPPEGYQGEVGEMGQPLDWEAYNAWVASLPTETRDNPYCCHFVQFEPNVTDEEILFVGELALDMGGKNWATRELHKNKNIPCNLLSRAVYDQAKSVVTASKESKELAVEKRMSMEPLGVEELEPHIESAVSKISECEARMEAFHATDFVAFEKTVPTNYSIRG